MEWLFESVAKRKYAQYVCRSVFLRALVISRLFIKICCLQFIQTLPQTYFFLLCMLFPLQEVQHFQDLEKDLAAAG